MALTGDLARAIVTDAAVRQAGGANVLRATLRVTFWGALALGITAGIGKLMGTVI